MRTKVKTEQWMGLIWGGLSNVVSLMTSKMSTWETNTVFYNILNSGWGKVSSGEKLQFIIALSPAYLPQGATRSCQNLWGNFRRGETKNISENVTVGCWEAALRESALKHSPQPSSEHLQTPLWFRKSAVVHRAWSGSYIKQYTAFFWSKVGAVLRAPVCRIN